MRCTYLILVFACLHLSHSLADTEPHLAARRRQLQQRNKEAVARLRSLLAEHLSQSPATAQPYPWRPAARRRRLAAAKPRYATQCLYEPIPPEEEPEDSSPSNDVAESADESGSAEEAQPADPAQDPAADAVTRDGTSASADQPSDAAAASTTRRRLQQSNQPGSPSPPMSPPSDASGAEGADGGAEGAGDAAAPDDETAEGAPPLAATGRCYLNPAVLAHPDFPEPETPIEIMLLKTGFTAYQCSFERREGRCGTYRHEPYDCRWQADQGRCAVPSDYLLPRLLTYLHCRDDAVISPFWDRCYRVGVVLTGGDNDWCGQPDGNLARCWWFPAREDRPDESDTCAPSPGGGVENREMYDELVSQMRSGTWQQDWFGSCPTSELIFSIKSACNYTTADDCSADPTCSLHPDLAPEYGMCRLRDDLVWNMFAEESPLFNATVTAMAECAAASDSLASCMAAGSLARDDGGGVLLETDRFSDVVDLVFIEEVTPGAAGAARPAAARTLLAAAAVALLAAALLGGRGVAGSGWM